MTNKEKYSYLLEGYRGGVFEHFVEATDFLNEVVVFMKKHIPDFANLEGHQNEKAKLVELRRKADLLKKHDILINF